MIHFYRFFFGLRNNGSLLKIRTNEKLGLTVNPHPIIEEDIIDCNVEVEDDFESSLDDHEKLNLILETQGKACRVHMEQEAWRSFQQFTKEEVNSGSVSGSTGECNSPVRRSSIALGEDGVGQDEEPGSVVVNTRECNSPDRVISTALDKESPEESHGVFKAVNVQQECFPDSFLREFSTNSEEVQEELLDVDEPPLASAAWAARAGRGVAGLLVDPVFHGWIKALRITGYMQGWKTSYLRSKHLIQDEVCRICVLGDHRWDPRNETEKAEQYFCSWEPERVKRTLKPTEMQRLIIDEGRLSSEYQIREQDLDQVGFLIKVGFLDKHIILGRIPVVFPDSPVLYSYLMYVHMKTSVHAFLETTVKEIHRKMRAVKGLRWLVKRVIADCVKCRLIEKKTMELRLANHPEARIVLTPCFHSCMMDVCDGFKGQTYKRSRMVIKIYALVIALIYNA